MKPFTLRRAYYERRAQQETGRMNVTQEDIVLAYLRKNKVMTQRDAVQIYIYRLSARIKDLRDKGFNIVTHPRKYNQLATYELFE